jgi:hypothetical protein
MKTIKKVCIIKNLEGTMWMHLSELLDPIFIKLELIVDYDLGLRKMIEAGKYERVNSEINEKEFPIIGEGKKTLNAVLVGFNQGISDDDLILLMRKYLARPANAAELLACGEQYPELQKIFKIMELGQLGCHVIGLDIDYSLILDSSGSERNLGLLRFGGIRDVRFRSLFIND